MTVPAAGARCADRHNVESLPQQLAGSTFRGEPSDGGDDRLGFTYDPVAFQVVFNTLPSRQS
ncbi:hypothetical protein U6M81_02315 [Cutibacterium acnes]|uniref:Uncharacterized protein n=1 Tax=Cutibacterium acnes TaxID=1747 RepID=A0AA44U4D2_CUTAC|nr:hypothetical protein [Cutibacterium acnes]MBU5171221.1 hypothetical protein [Cutibacterium acnes]MBU5175774.1 hypothetical protein [Cutibacterium acnes]MCD1048480.1 hypothetical protein [Cutibacterium acnes]MCD1077051.1 hypothetical protein [Cutibacterium acnes]MCD1081377.1 hypothetical protein [Cutibacterium acnes]